MLELRPTCENCAITLPPESTEAMICSFECTFCRACVDRLDNVCPNCAGGFSPRPIRPQTNWHDGNNLATYPASTVVRERPVDFDAHAALRKRVADRAPEQR
jgi:hypothetical protein